MPRRHTLGFLFLALALLERAHGAEPPGVVINHIPPAREVYIGSPGIAVLPNHVYLAKHDEFGPKSSERDSGTTQVFRSRDRGQTWQHAATVRGMYWASIFALGGDAPPRQHDANYLTFHRFRGFRELNMNDSAPGAGPDGGAWTPRGVPAAK